MKRIAALFVGIALSAMAVYGQSALPAISSENTNPQGQILIGFQSGALATGSQKSSGIGQLIVQLPASYGQSSAKRYPVVYCFHGYGDPADETLQAIAPYLAKNPDLPEVILVAVAGYDTFYSDSAVRGQGAAMVLQEVIPLIDSKYRTLANASGRMLAGFSMGGFGAWNLAITHPEVFCASWSACPGAFDQTGLKDAIATWDPRFFGDYAAAFATDRYKPNIRRAPKPNFDTGSPDAAYIQALENGFGSINAKLAAYQKAGAKLKALRVDFGAMDGYDWIPRGSQYLVGACQKQGIPSSIGSYNAGHQITGAMVENGFLPLLRAVFGK